MTYTEQDKVADALKHSWVYYLPKWIWPYAQLARWERPIGWQLLMWPCLWSLMLAWGKANADVSMPGSKTSMLITSNYILAYIFLFWAGSFLMRGAGCTYNDLVDKDIDDKVARTRSRPLPSGRVNKKQVLVFLALQLVLGLIVLLQFNKTVFWLGVASLVTVVIYPFMKRITWWPQLFLGLAFSWGALVGWWSLIGLSDASDVSLWAPPLLLYAGCICWVIAYDTIYAHQDIEDDALVGVMSTARLFGDNTKSALMILYAAAIILFACAFFAANVHAIGWLTLLLGALHLIWQVRNFELDNPEKCLMLFKSNSQFGMILLVGLMIAAIARII